MEREPNLLDEFFLMREEEMVEDMPNDQKTFTKILKNVKRKDCIGLVSQLPEEYSKIKQELVNEIEDMVTNYEIQIAYYNKKYYKQGFLDATKLNATINEKNKNQ